MPGSGREVVPVGLSLPSADQPYRWFVEHMSVGAAMVSAGGVVLYANHRLSTMLERPAAEILGRTVVSLLAEADRAAASGGFAATGLLEAHLVASGGRLVPVLIGTSALDPDGNGLTCLTFTDLSTRKNLNDVIVRLNQAQIDQLKELQDAQAALTLKATHDSLTGLPNRALLVDRVEQALARGLRSQSWTAVLFVDLDHFKQINDSRGHIVGDAILCQVAERFQAATRPMDTVARLGGDEFVVLTPDLPDEAEAVRIARRLATALGTGLDGGADGDLFTTASIGIAVAWAGAATPELMLGQADAAMYHAKSLGRNRAERFDISLTTRAAERTATQETLRLALDERRVVPYYQPIISLGNGEVSGFEALARIRKDDTQVLAPAAFISVAEESGLVVPLGEQMLARACRDARRWHEGSRQKAYPTVAVNLSSRQLERSDLAGQLRTILGETDLEARHLHLEITETALMELRPEVIEQLARVRELGVEIGLDDFGTGYASLTHLRRLPVSFVKLDRSFISGLGAEVQDERIVAAVVDLAAKLGLRSIAEGIETPQQLDRLRQFGCDEAQGYLFARPAPMADPARRYSVFGADYVNRIEASQGG